MKQTIKTFVSCLPLFCAIVCIFGVAYLAMQQYIRLSANEIPMQYAEDTRNQLIHNTGISDIFKSVPKIELGKSLSPFIIICDSNTAPQASTCSLNGRCPVPPKGAFITAQQRDQNRITWQPEPGIRNAIVILPFSMNGQHGYVLAGHSLRETEDRERFLQVQIAVGILLTLFVTFVTALISGFIKNKMNPES
jgi:hypothetical protein